MNDKLLLIAVYPGTNGEIFSRGAEARQDFEWLKQYKDRPLYLVQILEEVEVEKKEPTNGNSE